MNNPNRNLTTAERARSYTDAFTLPLDLIDDRGNASRFWFADDSDRQAFARLWNSLHDTYGHQTTVSIPEVTAV